MAKARSYLRFSTPGQAEGNSQDRQLDAARAYCVQHGHELDDSLRDLGVSAWRGKHRNKGALGTYLNLILTGDVKRGELLLIEDLDRLSREHPLDGLDLLRGIINAGVNVVLLRDGTVLSEASLRANPWGLLMGSLATMIRANEESNRKSFLVGKAWAKMRERAAQKPMTGTCPGWLKLNTDRTGWDVIAERAALVKRIFQACANGIGQDALARQLNREGIPSWGRGKYAGRGWNTTTIRNIVRGRSVLGELQPHTGNGGRDRKAAGDVIPNYYPRVIDDQLYYLAQGARTERQLGGGGRRGETVTNLFSKIATCGVCGTRMYLRNSAGGKRPGRLRTTPYRYLVCQSGRLGAKECHHSRQYNYESVESGVLDAVREFDPRSMHRKDAAAVALEQAEAMTAEIATKAEQLDGLIELRTTSNSGTVRKRTDIRIETLGHEIEQLERAVAELQISAKTAIARRSSDDRWLAMIKFVREMDGADPARRYELRSGLAQDIRRLGTRLVFEPGRCRVEIGDAVYLFDTRGDRFYPINRTDAATG